MRTSKLWTIVLAAACALLILTAAIAVPILCRPFYYAHITALDLPAVTGWSAEVIRAAYDEMLDFCIKGTPFGTGELAWSESGRSHFADCAVLFALDFRVLAGSALVLIAAFFLQKGRILAPARLRGHGFGFWGAAGLGSAFALTAALAAIDFNKAFVVFHRIFFPGKDNWIFDYRTDEIIRILPKVFFRNCAILIVLLILAACIALVAADLIRRRKTAGARS